MIARENGECAGFMACAMRESVILLLERERRNDAVMGDSAERKNGTQVRQGGYLGGEESPAGADLDRKRLVPGRHAADRVADAHAGKFESVIGAGLISSPREAMSLQ